MLPSEDRSQKEIHKTTMPYLLIHLPKILKNWCSHCSANKLNDPYLQESDHEM